MLHTCFQASEAIGSEEEDFLIFSISLIRTYDSLGWDHFWPKGHHLVKLGRDPLSNATY